MKEKKAFYSLRLRRLGIDTYQEPVIYMRRDCHVCRSEGFEAQSRIRVENGKQSVLATLNIVTTGILSPGEAGLSEAAWRLLKAEEGDEVTVSHPPPVESLSYVRGKVYGKRLSETAMREIVADIAAGRYSDVHLSAFITACAGGRMDLQEMVSLTQAMINAGDQIQWDRSPVMDKHCVGGLPGNRTTLIVVPIIAAFGLIMPKTSSRAITSPAGTVDTMETLAPVNLKIGAMRRVVEREGGCIVWGGAVRLSPADDILIRVERPLDFDSPEQVVSSILSKKVAAGSTHVVIDVPVGKTAKVRDQESAETLRRHLEEVGRFVGLNVCVLITDGTQPVGRGIGPALEARDVLAVLRREKNAPQDLLERSILLAGQILEFSSRVKKGEGRHMARAILSDGRAWQKFQAICEAQGGMREPAQATYSREITARSAGIVASIENRRLARVAKLSGAPTAPSAGVDLHTPAGTRVEKGQPVFTIYAETPGELDYALAYVETQPDIVYIQDIGQRIGQ
ncbi:MAG: thymidine phosphorylase family protein [Nitrospirae bacterium]|nr:thymidine phosphorylase family protein [Nitrospirota bacterium]